MKKLFLLVVALLACARPAVAQNTGSTNIGLTTAASCTGDANCTLIGHVRFLDKVFADIWSDADDAARVKIINGSAVVTEAATESAGVASTATVSAYIKAYDGSTFARLRSRAGLIGSADIGLVTRPFAWSDGTNTAPTMDAAARAGFQRITDGTNSLPTMDAIARPGFQKITDGTSTLVLDPCQGNAKVYTPISQTANTKLITGTSAKKTFICSILLVGADAENVSLVAGTGSVCATSTVAVLGGATAAAGPNLAANGGFSFGNGASAIAATTVNADDLCLFQSASGRVAGVMTSVVQ